MAPYPQIKGPAGAFIPPEPMLPVDALGTAALFGSTGLDFSANPPALPTVGSVWPNSGPYANYALLATVQASATRALIDVENTSGVQVAILRDDGAAKSGAAPTNASVFALTPGTGAGSQGGSWTSTTFKGRIQVYGIAGSQVTIMVD